MTEPLDLSANYTSAQYRYKEGGDGFTVENGKKIIDCSHMVNLLLKGAGYQVPYQNTASLNGAGALQYYDEISPSNVRKGDIALWINATSNHQNKTLNHTGIIESYDGTIDSEYGRFFGAQSSGPGTADVGAFGKSYFWPVPTKFLRVKESMRTGAATPATAPAPVPASVASPVMSFQYPIRKADGKQFNDADEIYRVLEGETSGHYLLGSNKFWHGGIHITDKSAPQCVLREPVRCMADGEVVAYRLNQDYLQSTFGDNEKKLKYSNSFCLVRHEYESAPNPEEGANKGKQNQLTFYSLYMHLLPHARYPLAPEETPAKKVTMQVGDFKAYPAAPPPGVVSQSDGKLVNGTQLEILETAESGELTYAKGKILSGSVKNVSTKTRGVGDVVWFAYLKNGVPYKNTLNKQIWKEEMVPERLRPNYWQGKVKAKLLKRLPLYDAPADPTNARPAGSPKGTLQLNVDSVIEFDSKAVLNLTVGNQTLRMAECTLVSGGLWGNGVVPPTFWVCIENAMPNKCVSWDTVTPSEFDSVVATGTGIKAGDPIGYLGLTENLTSEQGATDSKFQVHVEIFTAEAEVKDFLKNLAGLKSGKQYLHLPAGTELKKVAPATGTTPLKLDHAVDLGKVSVVKVGTEDRYNVSVSEDGQQVSGQLKKEGAKIITQNDWEKLGFQVVEETNATADGFLDPEDMPVFFKDLFAKIDANHDGEVDSAELANALKDHETRSRWSKLIAHHPTEWKDKADSAKWSKLDQLLETSPKTLKHEKERISSYVFWDELTGKAAMSSSLIWHFHPIGLLENFMSQSVYINVDRFVAMYAEQHTSFQSGAPALSAKSKENLREIIKNINIYVDKNKDLLTIYELSYMLATARHEAYNFLIPEYFSAAPEVGQVQYFDKYDPVLAPTAVKRQKAIDYGNTVQGDGYKYRGRGLVHLTWKNNYQKAKDYFGIDFVGNPEEAAGFTNSVPIMIWGMREGIFTNEKLGTYVNNTTKDYLGARKVINGSDQKVLIASYATKFEAIFRATSVAPETR